MAARFGLGIARMPLTGPHEANAPDALPTNDRPTRPGRPEIAPISIRAGTEEDVEAIAAVHVRASEAAYRTLGADQYLSTQTAARRREQWAAIFGDLAAPSAVFVAEIDHAIVGFAQVSPSRDDDAPTGTGELDRLYVDPEAWGSGVGSRLMAAAVAHLTASRFACATLWVLERNDRARRFYETAGWVADGVSEPAGSWVGFANVRYQRLLDPPRT